MNTRFIRSNQDALEEFRFIVSNELYAFFETNAIMVLMVRL